MIMEGARSTTLPNGGHCVDSAKSSFIYWYGHDCQVNRSAFHFRRRCSDYKQVVSNGSLRVQFNQHGKIEVMDYAIAEPHTEYVPRSKLLAPLDSPEQKPSPNASKGSGKRAAQQRMHQKAPEQSAQAGPPRSPIESWGVTKAVFSIIEVRYKKSSHAPYLILHSSPKPYPEWKTYFNTRNKIPNSRLPMHSASSSTPSKT